MAFWKVDKEVARRVPRLGLEASILFSELREREAALKKRENWFYVKAEFLEKALGITKEKRRKLSALLESAKLIEISRHGKDNKQFYKLPQVSCLPSSAGSPAQLETQPAGELETSPTHLYINKETEYNKETEEDLSPFKKELLLVCWNDDCKLKGIKVIPKGSIKGVTEFFKGTGELPAAQAIQILIKEINNSEWLLSQRWATFSWIFSLESKDSTGDGKQYNFMKAIAGNFNDKTENKNLTSSQRSQHRSSEVNQNLTQSILPS